MLLSESTTVYDCVHAFQHQHHHFSANQVTSWQFSSEREMDGWDVLMKWPACHSSCRVLLWVCPWSRWCRGWTAGPRRPATRVHTPRASPSSPRPTTHHTPSPRGSERTATTNPTLEIPFIVASAHQKHRQRIHHVTDEPTVNQWAPRRHIPNVFWTFLLLFEPRMMN